MTDVAKKDRKRWGKKFVDARDWPRYNEQLVRRDEYLTIWNVSGTGTKSSRR